MAELLCREEWKSFLPHTQLRHTQSGGGMHYLSKALVPLSLVREPAQKTFAPGATLCTVWEGNP